MPSGRTSTLVTPLDREMPLGAGAASLGAGSAAVSGLRAVCCLVVCRVVATRRSLCDRKVICPIPFGPRHILKTELGEFSRPRDLPVEMTTGLFKRTGKTREELLSYGCRSHRERGRVGVSPWGTTPSPAKLRALLPESS